MNVEALTCKNEYENGVLVQLIPDDIFYLKRDMQKLDDYNFRATKRLIEWILEEWEK